MIAKREARITENAPKTRSKVQFKSESEDPDNRNDAMLLLGIAERAAPW